MMPSVNISIGISAKPKMIATLPFLAFRKRQAVSPNLFDSR
jgi:hypothetical protein